MKNNSRLVKGLDIEGYIEAQRANLESIKKLPHFSILVSLMNQFRRLQQLLHNGIQIKINGAARINAD